MRPATGMVTIIVLKYSVQWSPSQLFHLDFTWFAFILGAFSDAAFGHYVTVIIISVEQSIK